MEVYAFIVASGDTRSDAISARFERDLTGVNNATGFLKRKGLIERVGRYVEGKRRVAIWRAVRR